MAIYHTLAGAMSTFVITFIVDNSGYIFIYMCIYIYSCVINSIVGNIRYAIYIHIYIYILLNHTPLYENI